MRVNDDPSHADAPPAGGRGMPARRSRPRFALLALPLALLVGCSADDEGDGAADDMASASFINHSAAPLVGITARDEGFFDRAGIDVEFAELPTGTEAIAAMTGGSADFVLAADARLIQSAGQDLDVVAVGIHNTGFLGSLIVHADDQEVEDMSDLTGRRLAVQVGSGVHTVWLRYLKSVGLTPEDFEVTNMAVADMPAALEGGSIDGGLVWQPHGARSELQGIATTAMTSHEIAEPLNLVYPFYLITTRETVENDPEMVQRFVNAFACTKAWIGENPDGALDNLDGFYEDLERDVVDVMFNERDYSTYVELSDEVVADTEAQAEQLLENGDITEVPDLGEYFDNSFAANAQDQEC